MNVMAQAHKATKALISSMSAEGQAQVKAERLYARMFALHLKHFHKEYKAMQKQTEKAVAIKCVNVDIHDLVEGDEVLCHGAVFKIHTRKEWNDHPGTDTKAGSVVSFATDLVWHPDFCKAPNDEPYYPFPLGWAKTYGLQSNSLMSWAKIVKRPALPNEKKF